MSPLQVSLAETEEGPSTSTERFFFLSMDFFFDELFFWGGFLIVFVPSTKKGDCAETEEGPLPQTAQVAAQQGAFVAHLLNDEINRAATAAGHTMDTKLAHRYSPKVRAL